MTAWAISTKQAVAESRTSGVRLWGFESLHCHLLSGSGS